MSKIIFLNNFQIDPNNPNKYINNHTPSFGVPTIECRVETGYFCKLNTGLYCYRESCYTQSSPYGWEDFHKLISKQISLDKKIIAKLKEFDLECKYLIGIHKSNLRPLFKSNDYTRDLNRQENTLFFKHCEDFANKYEGLFKQFGFDDKLQELYQNLENFGLTI